jgi:hypothetical protein
VQLCLAGSTAPAVGCRFHWQWPVKRQGFHHFHPLCNHLFNAYPGKLPVKQLREP